MHNRSGFRFVGRLDIPPWIERKQQGPVASAGEIVCAVTRFAARTTIGSQDVTTPDLNGLTPKAVIFVATRCIADGTPAAHTQMSFGAATGPANEWVVSTNTTDAAAVTNTRAETLDTACIVLHTPGSGADIANADFTTFIANGCTLNWSNVDAAFLITAIFFAGADLSAHANTEALGDILNNAVDITNPGFEPDLIVASIANTRPVNTNNAPTGHSVGFCSNDGAGGIVQRCVGSQFRDGQGGTTSSNMWTRNDSVVAGIGASGLRDWEGILSGFDALGFTCTTVTAGANNTALGYLALSFGGVADFWVGTHTAPVGIGNNAEIGPGFTPQLAMRVMTQAPTFNTLVSSGDASGTWGISAIDADDEFAASISDEDGISLGVTNAQSLSDDTSIELPDDDGTVGLIAAFVSFDANGWTDDYTAVKATAGLMPALAIGS